MTFNSLPKKYSNRWCPLCVVSLLAYTLASLSVGCSIIKAASDGMSLTKARKFDMTIISNQENTLFEMRISSESHWTRLGKGKILQVEVPRKQPFEIAAKPDGFRRKLHTLSSPVRELRFTFWDPADREGEPTTVEGLEPPSAGGGQGEPVYPALSKPVGQRWAVVIGVSQYRFAGQGGLGRLAFADKDAKDFANILKTQGWGQDNIRLLTNEKATKRKIEYALETWLQRAGADDLIVLFWSAHGWPDASDVEKAYFACYDSKPSDPSSGFRMDQVRRMLSERKARNVIVIADTCHSGKVIRAGDPKRIAVRPALEAMKRKKQIPKGWIFIASAEPDRKAYEDKAWNNGALTHVLLEGMRDNKADGYQSVGAKDGIVTLGELRAYISDRMREESLNIIGARLDPLFYTTSGDPKIWNLTLKVK